MQFWPAKYRADRFEKGDSMPTITGNKVPITDSLIKQAHPKILLPPGSFQGGGSAWQAKFQSAQSQFRLSFLKRATNQGAAADEIAAAIPRNIEIAVAISGGRYIDSMIGSGTIAIMDEVDHDL